MTVHISKPRHQESGGVLLWIFVAIAAFAALSFAIARGQQSSGVQILSDQQATILATEVLNFSKRVENAVQRLLMQGCSENEISFGNTVFLNGDGEILQPMDHNPNAPDNFRCHIFHPKGGGIKPLIISKSAHDPNIHPEQTNRMPGHAHLSQGLISGVGRESEYELLLSINHLHMDVCRRINDLAGVENPDGNPVNTSSGTSGWNGSFRNTVSSNHLFDGILTGKTSFCFHGGNSTSYNFRHVLLPR